MKYHVQFNASPPITPKLVSPPTAGSIGSPMTTTSVPLKSDTRILWLDVMDEFIFAGSPEGIRIIKTGLFNTSLSYKFPFGTKLEKAYLDRASGVVYGLIVSESLNESASSSDLFQWQPNLKEFRRSSEPNPEITLSTMGCDVSPPREDLDLKALEEWTVMDVTYWLADLGYHEYREVFFASGVNGKRLTSMTVQGLKQLGVHETAHRTKMLIDLSQRSDAVSKINAKVPLLALKNSRDRERERRASVPMDDSADDTETSLSESGSTSESSEFGADKTRARSVSEARVIGLISVREKFKELSIHRTHSDQTGLIYNPNQNDKSRGHHHHHHHHRHHRDRNDNPSSSSSSSTTTATAATEEHHISITNSITRPEKLQDKPTTAPAASGAPASAAVLKIECTVDDTGETFELEFESMRITMTDLHEGIVDALESDISDPERDLAIMIASEHGLIALFSQYQLDEAIATLPLKATNVLQIWVSIGRSTRSDTSWARKDVLTMQQARDRVTLRRYPCALVEDGTLNICWMNAIGQKELGFSLAELVGKNFDSRLVLPGAAGEALSLKAHLTDILRVRPSFRSTDSITRNGSFTRAGSIRSGSSGRSGSAQRAAFLAALDQPPPPILILSPRVVDQAARTEWKSILQHKDGVIKTYNLVASSLTVDGNRYYQIGIRDLDDNNSPSS